MTMTSALAPVNGSESIARHQKNVENAEAGSKTRPPAVVALHRNRCGTPTRASS
jgi:hypothetical protein